MTSTPLGDWSQLVGESIQAWYASHFGGSDGFGKDVAIHFLSGLHQGHPEDSRCVDLEIKWSTACVIKASAHY